MFKWNVATDWIYNFPMLQPDLKLSSMFFDSSCKCCIAAPRTFVVGPTAVSEGKHWEVFARGEVRPADARH